MDRRRFLVATGALSPFLCGCLTIGPGRGERPPTTESRGPTRGESDVEIAVEEIEDDEEVEYVEEDHAVRYVAAWRHANHAEVEAGEPPEREAVYDTTPFERWGETQCLRAAARAAARHVNDELDTDEVSGGTTSLGPGRNPVARVSVHTVLDRRGGVIHDPSVEFEALVDATPSTVEASYRLADHAVRMDVPVYAGYDVVQQD